MKRVRRKPAIEPMSNVNLSKVTWAAVGLVALVEFLVVAALMGWL